MAAVSRDAPNRFRVRFREIASPGVKRIFGGGFFQVDPYVIARAIAQVMRYASMRSASGRALVWNEYRVILGRDDFEGLRALQARMQAEIGAVLGEEARRLDAELVGDLCVQLLIDEGQDVPPEEGVICVAFVPSERLASAPQGEMTIRLDRGVIAGLLPVPPAPAPTRERGGEQTVHVTDPALVSGAGWTLRWAGAAARIPEGIQTVVGRPHAPAPPHFIALEGASQKINKLHFWLLCGPAGVVVGRPPDANPVAVDGTLIKAAGQLEVARPEFQIELSRGELLLTMAKSR